MDKKERLDAVVAALNHLDSDEYRESYGSPPGTLRAHLIKLAGHLKDECENPPAHYNHDEPDRILGK